MKMKKKNMHACKREKKKKNMHACTQAKLSGVWDGGWGRRFEVGGGGAH